MSPLMLFWPGEIAIGPKLSVRCWTLASGHQRAAATGACFLGACLGLLLAAAAPANTNSAAHATTNPIPRCPLTTVEYDASFRGFVPRGVKLPLRRAFG